MTRFLYSLLFFSIITTAISQTSTDSAALRALLVGRVLPQEYVFLHFDNTSYYLDETIWFKAFITSGIDNRPTELSRVLYVELVSPEGYVVKTNKYKIGEDGTCHGDIYLDPLYLSGYYEIRAYTRYMLNWGDEAVFSRVFPVFDKVNNGDWGFRNIRARDKGVFVNKNLQKEKKPNLKFYPESGHLVNGIESKVAYELTGYKGIDEYENITILANDHPLISTTPEHMGKGTFVFTPQSGIKYHAVTNLRNENGKLKEYKFTLPVIENKGVVIKVIESADSVSFTITDNYTEESDMGFAILHRGNMGFYKKIIDKKDVFNIAKNEIPEGVSRAVVFHKETPLAERMFFVQHDEIQADDKGTVKLNVTGNGYMLHNLEAKPHEKISIVVTREDGKPLDENTSFTFAVTDQAGKLTTSWGYNLHTYMLLGSEVKGYIPDAYQYFNPENSRRKEHLDLVMLTNGWTAYRWEKLTAENFNSISLPEDGLTISGKLTMRVKERKFWNNGLYKSYPQPYNNIRVDYNAGADFIKTQVVRTDSAGNFSFIIDDFTGRETIALSPNTIFKHSENIKYSFLLDKYFSPKPKPFDYWQCNTGRSIRNGNDADSVSGMKKIDIKEYLIEQIDITAKLKKDISQTAPISEIRFDYLDEWEYAIDNIYTDGMMDNHGNTYYESMEQQRMLQETHNITEKDVIRDTDEALSINNTTLLKVNERLGWLSSEIRSRNYQYHNVLTVMDVVNSIYQRYNLGWQNWVQPVVVKGEYNKDSIPVADEEYLHGINVEKMTNFQEIIITSDRKKIESIQGGENVWDRRNAAYANKGCYAYFYNGFLFQCGTYYDIKNNSRMYDPEVVEDLYLLALRIKDSNGYSPSMIERMEHPNQVAYLIPDTSDNKTRIKNDLSVSSSTRRYTSLHGYNESKQFYSPDYSNELPDEKDYRRTLIWNPDVKPVDGKLEVDIYNSSICNAIAVEVLGYKDNIIYSNDLGIKTRENLKKWKESRENFIALKSEFADSAFLSACDAEFKQAEIYYNKKNYKKALTTYIELAQYNYPKAFYKIGIFYLKGTALKRRTDLAAQFFERGAVLGIADCFYELSQMYRDGLHYKQDFDKEIYFLKIAADMCCPEAALRLGKYLLNGTNIEKDTLRAATLLYDVAKTGLPEGLYEYAQHMIREGLKTDKILGTPNECIKKAADNGFTPAMWHMLSHEEQVGNYNAVYNIAKMLYIQGDVNAIKYLADCYFYGIGVKRDKRLAKDFYREAAKKGNKDAQDFLEKW